MNTIQADTRRRDKSSIAEIRSVYLDFDVDGDRALAHLRDRADLPVPNYIVSTSPHKYQVLWHVEQFSLSEAEVLLRALARDTGGDIAATDAARVLRVPGFYNHKYDPAYFVTAQRLGDGLHRPDAFPRYPQIEATPLPRTSPAASHPRSPGASDRSRSGLDWRTTLSRLRRGDDPAAVVADLMAARSDKSNPNYYAQRTVDRALEVIRRTPSLSTTRTHLRWR